MIGSSEIKLAWQPQANEIFALMPRDTRTRLEGAGVRFYAWHSPNGYPGPIPDDHVMTRFVTSFATTAEDVDRFGELIG